MPSSLISAGAQVCLNCYDCFYQCNAFINYPIPAAYLMFPALEEIAGGRGIFGLPRTARSSNVSSP